MGVAPRQFLECKRGHCMMARALRWSEAAVTLQLRSGNDSVPCEQLSHMAMLRCSVEPRLIRAWRSGSRAMCLLSSSSKTLTEKQAALVVTFGLSNLRHLRHRHVDARTSIRSLLADRRRRRAGGLRASLIWRT